MDEDDPTTIRSLAVSPEDVVDAFVYGRENPGDAVLRVTPPFHGRMRARLHVYRVDDAPVTGAVHLEPTDLLADDAVAAYPDLEDVREGADELDAEDVRERRGEALEGWQERARDALRETVALEADGERHRVEIKRLG